MTSHEDTHQTARGDRGAILIITALCITALFLILAIVIDLGATRSERRDGQLAVDNAASAAGFTMADANAEDACETAIAYLELTLDASLGFTGGTSCTDFSSCVTGRVVTAQASNYQITLHHPVDNTSPLLQQPGTIGAASGPFSSDRPGTPCERFGVELSTTGSSYFGGVAGESDRPSNVHAVVAVSPPTPAERLINLAVLERKDCLDPSKDPPEPDASRGLRATGNGKIVVAKIIDGATEYPGTLSVDSDGTGANCGSGATIAATGGNSVIRADGPGPCSDATDPPTGSGCGAGVIELFASGAPGCNTPACFKSPAATLSPSPIRATTQLTRAPVDHVFNCKSSYSASGDGSAADERWAGPTATFTDAVTGEAYNSQPIVGCTGGTAYIDALESTYGSGALTSLGFKDYVAEGEPCGAITTAVTLTGNWHINCDVTIKNSFTVTDGSVVFDGDLVLTSDSANLQVNVGASTPHFMYMRGGGAAVLQKDAGATMSIDNTMLYIGKDVAAVGFAGGTGALTLASPTTGSFENLAVWSETAVAHSFSGQATFNIDGTFFAPLALIDYAGTTDKDIAAQFVSRTITARGLGRLTLKPTRGVDVPDDAAKVQLIR